MIYDQKEVFEYYNKAKVLLSTSRHEGFANVYSQAAAMGCYIISTDVGGADVASNNWQYGTLIEQDDVVGLAKIMEKLVNNRMNIDTEKSLSIKSISYSYMIANILLPKMDSV